MTGAGSFRIGGALLGAILLVSSAIAQEQTAPVQGATTAPLPATLQPSTPPAESAAPQTGAEATQEPSAQPDGAAATPAAADAPAAQPASVETAPGGAATTTTAQDGSSPAATATDGAAQPAADGATSETEGAISTGAQAPAVGDASSGDAAGSEDVGVSDTEAAPEEEMDLFSQMLSPQRSDLPHDLSPWGMFMAADWVVKAVMIGLAFASLITWTVWVAKSLEVAGAKTRARAAYRAVTASSGLADAVGALAGKGGPGALMVRAAQEEMRQSERALDYAGNGGVKERLVSRLSRIEAQAGRRLTRGTGVLATIGSTAPFVGLFGTVWGIMNSFIGISEAQTTNLAIVAPGIAEALLATAIGLVAAIPAVVIYNVFARSITGYRQLLADTSAGVERLVSRDLDYRKVPGHGHGHGEAPAISAER